MGISGDGGLLVSGPAFRAARFGLLAVADVELVRDGHWQSGIEHDVESCDDLFALQPCPPADIPAKDPGTGPVGTEFADPFWLVAGYKCSVGGRPVEEAWDFAQRRLDRGEGRSLERTFWTGRDRDNNPVRQSLAGNPDTVDLTPVAGAVQITDGVAMLESFLGDCYPGSGVIHASRGLGTYLGERNLLVRDGDVMRATGTDTAVVIGGGYPITGPAGVVPAAGEAWLFATGGIKVLRGEAFFTPPRGDLAGSIDRTINDQVVYAERPYATLLDCCIAAVRVVLGSCCDCKGA